MNPASKLIRQLRLDRALSQKEAANLLGYEQSFLSAIEGSSKDVPKKYFIDQIIKKYRLTQEEQKQLNEAIVRSNRKLVIPPKSPESVYNLIYRMNEQIEHLSDRQIKLIDIALEIQ